jgi:hypothetical protein
MRRVTLKMVLLVLAVLAASIYGIRKLVIALRSDETRVLLALEDVAEYANDRDTGGVLEYVDPEFKGARGHDYKDVASVVRYVMFKATSVDVQLEPVSPVRVEGDLAHVRVLARVLVRLPGESLTLANAGYPDEQVDVTLRRHESYFRALSVRPADAAEAGPP